MNFSTLSLLCLLAWSLPFTLSFLLWKAARGWQRSAKGLKPPLFHTVNRLLPPIPTHCDTLMYHEVPYDFKYDWPATCQGIRCLSLQGEKGEFVNLGEFSGEVQANELAFPLMEHGLWLGVHRDAGLGLLVSVEIKCLTVLRVYCVFSSLSAR